MKNLNEIVAAFQIEGSVAHIEPLGEGFINDTYCITTLGDDLDYILQRKNHQIFLDVPAMMNNIELVTDHIRHKVAQRGGDVLREVLTVIKTHEGENYMKDDLGNYWTVCIKIPNSKTYDKADSLDLCYKSGVGIGRFQSDLSDFNQPLAETIKGFHNIKYRYQQWDEIVKANPVGRLANITEDLVWIEAHRAEMIAFWDMVEDGQLPMRVTHNDTKLSNVLFDEHGEVLCMIDLDTVMSSTSLNDFGDAIRSYANTCAEDDPNLSAVQIEISRFEAYTKGYLSERAETMTETEKAYLAFSALYITFEQALRFMWDYIQGDQYWKVKHDGHNLDRARNQYKLYCSMRENYATMQQIVESNL